MPGLTRRTAATVIGAAALGVRSRSAAAASSPVLPDADGARFRPWVDRDLWPFIDWARALAQRKFSAETLGALRAKQAYPAPSPSPAWEERLIPGPKAAPDLRIYIVGAGTPGPEPVPAILHMHGGGFIYGRARNSIRNLQEIAATLNCLIVTVDYRLAPETPYPGALEDNYAALSWLHANADALGVDRRRIILMGESAGGGHAAMLALEARDRGEIPIKQQMLIYPMLDDRTGGARQPSGVQGALAWSAPQNLFGWMALLGHAAGSTSTPHGAVPARVEDLSRLPPTFIGVGSIDLFINEDLEFALRLIDAGVPTEVAVVPGAFHGFINLRGVGVSETFRSRQLAALQRAMA